MLRKFLIHLVFSFSLLITLSPIATAETTISNPLSNEMCRESNLLGCRDMQGRLVAGVEHSYAYREIIPYVIKKILEIGSGLAVLLLIYSAYLFLTQSLEGESEVEKAKDNIIYIVLGLIFMLLSRAIVSIVENLPLG